MRHSLPLTFALAAIVSAGPVLAAGGDADPAGATGAGKARSATRDERVQARKDRLKETARENRSGELSTGGEASGAPAASDDHKYTKSERAQARKDRLKETARENRGGEIKSGER